jgi:hypothetical protein
MGGTCAVLATLEVEAEVLNPRNCRASLSHVTRLRLKKDKKTPAIVSLSFLLLSKHDYFFNLIKLILS